MTVSLWGFIIWVQKNSDGLNHCCFVTGNLSTFEHHFIARDSQTQGLFEEELELWKDVISPRLQSYCILLWYYCYILNATSVVFWKTDQTWQAKTSVYPDVGFYATSSKTEKILCLLLTCHAFLNPLSYFVRWHLSRSYKSPNISFWLVGFGIFWPIERNLCTSLQIIEGGICYIALWLHFKVEICVWIQVDSQSHFPQKKIHYVTSNLEKKIIRCKWSPFQPTFY